MRLNSVLDDIAHVAGYTAARRIAAWWPGRNLYIPATPRRGHPIEHVAGASAFRALVEAFPVQFLAIPNARDDDRDRRERDIAAALAKGVADAELAAVHGVSVRRIGQIRQALLDNGLLDYAKLEDENSI